MDKAKAVSVAYKPLPLLGVKILITPDPQAPKSNARPVRCSLALGYAVDNGTLRSLP